jgi:hypothetical protein
MPGVFILPALKVFGENPSYFSQIIFSTHNMYYKKNTRRIILLMNFSHIFPQNTLPIQPLSLVEPYLVQSLQKLIGKRLIVDTVRGVVQGNLVDVKTDHIVLKELDDDLPTFVRIQQIVYIMPLPNK